PEKYNAGYLGRALAERMSEEKGSKALFLRASVGSEQLPLALAEKSLPFLDIAVYDTYYCGDNSPRIKALIEAYDFDLAVFTSASTVRGFAQALPGIDLRPIKALCIGEQTAAEAKKLFAAIYISSNATIDSLADKMAELAVIGEI
ncbi:MAG: uroporphyrinogen-III synthase, partial [Clostridiales bacterium]